MPRTRPRPSPSEQEAKAKKDFEERRKARLLQVRQQESAIAADVRGRFRHRLSTEHEQLAAQLQAEWNDYQDTQNRTLRERQELAAKHFGEAHQRAAAQPTIPYQKTVAGIEEAKQKAQHRHEAALRRRSDEDKCLRETQSRHLDNRQSAVAAEKQRSRRVASKPLKTDDELADLLANSIVSGTVRSTKAPHGPTYHHLPARVVAAQADPRSAMLDAEDEENEQEVALQLKERMLHERDEVARVRHQHALQHVRLRRDYEQQLKELEAMKKADNLQRRKQVESVPKHLFVTPLMHLEQQQAEEEELQRRVERTCLNHAPPATSHREPPQPLSSAAATVGHPVGDSASELSVSALSSSSLSDDSIAVSSLALPSAVGAAASAASNPDGRSSTQPAGLGSLPAMHVSGDSDQSQPLSRLLEHVRSQQRSYQLGSGHAGPPSAASENARSTAPAPSTSSFRSQHSATGQAPLPTSRGVMSSGVAPVGMSQAGAGSAATDVAAASAPSNGGHSSGNSSLAHLPFISSLLSQLHGDAAPESVRMQAAGVPVSGTLDQSLPGAGSLTVEQSRVPATSSQAFSLPNESQTSTRQTVCSNCCRGALGETTTAPAVADPVVPAPGIGDRHVVPAQPPTANPPTYVVVTTPSVLTLHQLPAAASSGSYASSSQSHLSMSSLSSLGSHLAHAPLPATVPAHALPFAHHLPTQHLATVGYPPLSQPVSAGLSHVPGQPVAAGQHIPGQPGWTGAYHHLPDQPPTLGHYNLPGQAQPLNPQHHLPATAPPLSAATAAFGGAQAAVPSAAAAASPGAAVGLPAAPLASMQSVLPGWEDTQAELATYRQSQQELLEQFRANMAQLQRQQVSLSLMMHDASRLTSPGGSLASMSRSSYGSPHLPAMSHLTLPGQRDVSPAISQSFSDTSQASDASESGLSSQTDDSPSPLPPRSVPASSRVPLNPVTVSVSPEPADSIAVRLSTGAPLLGASELIPSSVTSVLNMFHAPATSSSIAYGGTPAPTSGPSAGPGASAFDSAALAISTAAMNVPASALYGDTPHLRLAGLASAPASTSVVSVMSSDVITDQDPDPAEAEHALLDVPPEARPTLSIIVEESSSGSSGSSSSLGSLSDSPVSRDATSDVRADRNVQPLPRIVAPTSTASASLQQSEVESSSGSSLSQPYETQLAALLERLRSVQAELPVSTIPTTSGTSGTAPIRGTGLTASSAAASSSAVLSTAASSTGGAPVMSSSTATAPTATTTTTDMHHLRPASDRSSASGDRLSRLGAGSLLSDLSTVSTSDLDIECNLSSSADSATTAATPTPAPSVRPDAGRAAPSLLSVARTLPESSHASTSPSLSIPLALVRPSAHAAVVAATSPAAPVSVAPFRSTPAPGHATSWSGPRHLSFDSSLAPPSSPPAAAAAPAAQLAYTTTGVTTDTTASTRAKPSSVSSTFPGGSTAALSVSSLSSSLVSDYDDIVAKPVYFTAKAPSVPALHGSTVNIILNDDSSATLGDVTVKQSTVGSDGTAAAVGGTSTAVHSDLLSMLPAPTSGTGRESPPVHLGVGPNLLGFDSPLRGYPAHQQPWNSKIFELVQSTPVSDSSSSASSSATESFLQAIAPLSPLKGQAAATTGPSLREHPPVSSGAQLQQPPAVNGSDAQWRRQQNHDQLESSLAPSLSVLDISSSSTDSMADGYSSGVVDSGHAPPPATEASQRQQQPQPTSFTVPFDQSVADQPLPGLGPSASLQSSFQQRRQDFMKSSAERLEAIKRHDRSPGALPSQKAGLSKSMRLGGSGKTIASGDQDTGDMDDRHVRFASPLQEFFSSPLGSLKSHPSPVSPEEMKARTQRLWDSLEENRRKKADELKQEDARARQLRVQQLQKKIDANRSRKAVSTGRPHIHAHPLPPQRLQDMTVSNKPWK